MPVGPPLFIKPRSPPSLAPGFSEFGPVSTALLRLAHPISPAAAARYLPRKRRTGAERAAEQLDVRTFATRPRASQHPRCLAARSGTCLIIAEPRLLFLRSRAGSAATRAIGPAARGPSPPQRSCGTSATADPRPPVQSPHRLHTICMHPSRLAGCTGPARRVFPHRAGHRRIASGRPRPCGTGPRPGGQQLIKLPRPRPAGSGQPRPAVQHAGSLTRAAVALAVAGSAGVRWCAPVIDHLPERGHLPGTCTVPIHHARERCGPRAEGLSVRLPPIARRTGDQQTPAWIARRCAGDAARGAGAGPGRCGPGPAGRPARRRRPRAARWSRCQSKQIRRCQSCAPALTAVRPAMAIVPGSRAAASVRAGERRTGTRIPR